MQIKALLFLLSLLLFSNCTTTNTGTRLERWSGMMLAEKELFEPSLSEFGKLKPAVAKSVWDRNTEILSEEYVAVQIASEDFADEICKNIADYTISSSKDWTERVNRYIATKNVNLDTLEKSFNYKSKEFGRDSCKSVSPKNQPVLDDIVKLIGKIKEDLDDPKKGDRKRRLYSLWDRMGIIKQEKLNNELKNEVYQITDSKINIIEKIKSNPAPVNSFLLGITLKGLSYLPIEIAGGIVVGFSSLFVYLALNPQPEFHDKRIVDDFIAKNQSFNDAINENKSLLSINHYILMNDKENNYPGFEEFAASLDYQISNYEDLYHYFNKSHEIVFKTKEVQELCIKYECNKKADVDTLKKNAALTIQELKKRRK